MALSLLSQPPEILNIVDTEILIFNILITIIATSAYEWKLKILLISPFCRQSIQQVSILLNDIL